MGSKLPGPLKAKSKVNSKQVIAITRFALMGLFQLLLFSQDQGPEIAYLFTAQAPIE